MQWSAWDWWEQNSNEQNCGNYFFAHSQLKKYYFQVKNNVIESKTIPDRSRDRWFPSNDRVAYDDKVEMGDEARADDDAKTIPPEHYDIFGPNNFGFNDIRFTDDYGHNDKANGPKSLKPDQTNTSSNFSNTAIVVGYKVY